MLVLLRLYGVCVGRLCSYYAIISGVCSTKVHNRIRIKEESAEFKNGFSQISATKRNRLIPSFNTVFALYFHSVFCLCALLFWTSVLTFFEYIIVFVPCSLADLLQ